MKDIDQIASESAMAIANLMCAKQGELGQIQAIIKSAIEKAKKAGYKLGLEKGQLLAQQRAAHAFQGSNDSDLCDHCGNPRAAHDLARMEYAKAEALSKPDSASTGNWAKAYGPNDEVVQIGGMAFKVNISAKLVADTINAKLATTPSGGGEWMVSEHPERGDRFTCRFGQLVFVCLDNERDHYQRVADAHNAALRDRELACCKDKRDGNWIDEFGCCKVCDGEIPHGHTNHCYIWKLEQVRDCRNDTKRLIGKSNDLMREAWDLYIDKNNVPEEYAKAYSDLLFELDHKMSQTKEKE